MMPTPWQRTVTTRIVSGEQKHGRSKKRKFKKTTKRTRGPYSHMSDRSGFAVPWNIPMASTSTRGSHFPMAARQDYSFRGFGNPAFGGTAVQGAFSGACFACGSFSHFRKNCPYANGGESSGTKPLENE